MYVQYICVSIKEICCFDNCCCCCYWGWGWKGRKREARHFRNPSTHTAFSEAINDQPLLGHLLQLLGHNGVPHADLHLQLPAHHALPVIHQLWGQICGMRVWKYYLNTIITVGFHRARSGLTVEQDEGERQKEKGDNKNTRKWKEGKHLEAKWSVEPIKGRHPYKPKAYIFITITPWHSHQRSRAEYTWFPGSPEEP